ncbi:MAG: DUF885 domain-containing protein [Acidimicrobiia bacterium]|nr:DUF885 domain-containing protein [Acidimicrobiia bacterium]
MQNHPIYQLSSDIVDQLAATFPDIATEVGIAGHDDRWTDLSPEGGEAALHTLRVLRRQVDSVPAPANDWDRVAIDLAKVTLEEEASYYEHEDHLRDLNSMASPLQAMREIWDHMSKETDEDWTNIVYRLERLPAALDGYRTSLDEGRRKGMAVAERQVRAAVEQCRVSAGTGSRLVKLLDAYEEASGGGAMVGRLETAVTDARAAFSELADYLADTYATDAAERDGVGSERYVRAAYEFLGTRIDPMATYDWGWEQIAELSARMKEVAAEIQPAASMSEIDELLRTDPLRTVPDADALSAFIQDRLDDALARLTGTHFDVPEPIRTVTVNIAPPGSSLGAYYVGPSEDFTRPGSVWWSLTPSGPYPVFDEVSTAYHEGFPGHHLQVGVQVSLADKLSRLHRLWVWKSGSGEGWALYAERFMNELGFFEKPDYVFGWLSGQMLRACRVVIDIGSHLDLPIPDSQPFYPGEKWTFDKAVAMLIDYAALGRPYAESEVTRYLGWPGQAISYKVGEKAILEIRDEVKARLGDAFDTKAFHARLLEVGPVGLDLLRAELAR